MEPRQWQIVFHLHADMSATAHVHVNGRLLMPHCTGLPVPQALGYVSAALVDCHPGDKLGLRTQGSAGTIRSNRLLDPAQAEAWLRARVGELMLARKRDAEPSDSEGARSGLRSALTLSDAGENLAGAKKFTS